MKIKKILLSFKFLPMPENEFVDLSHRKLQKIPFIPQEAVKLSLRRNILESMACPFLTNTKDLDLSDNKIKKIEYLENIPNLKTLDLSYNLITQIKIPFCFLEELYLIGNDISKIEILNLPNLKILDLAVNDISKIENLDKCLELTELYLGSNKISSCPDLTFLKNLKVLDLQNNKLNEIDCKKFPISIEQLLLSENHNLKKIIEIDRLENLKLLAIRKTNVKEIKNIKNLEIWT